MILDDQWLIFNKTQSEYYILLWPLHKKKQMLLFLLMNINLTLLTWVRFTDLLLSHCQICISRQNMSFE